MAFGNATKGYVKKHGGSGGGGGTTDYEKLLNKPSINGVELLGDKKIGTLSGDIKMTLSDVSNMNLSNVANAQSLIFNALNQKWENGGIPSKIDYISYVGDGTRSRLFNVGTFKSIRFYVEDSTTHASSNLINSGDTNFYTTWIEGGSIRTGVGSVVREGTNIGLSGSDDGQEYNHTGINYVIQIFR